MKKHEVLAIATAVAALLAGVARSAGPPTSGLAANGSPGWHLQKGFPDPGGRTAVDDQGRVTVIPRQPGARGLVGGDLPRCSHSTICTRRGGPSRQATDRVVWDQTMGYSISYPFHMPPGLGGDPGVAVDSKGDVWILQRKPQGMPQLFKYDRNAHLILTVAPDVIGYQEKAHGMTIDGHDNVWFADTNGATVMEVGPDGRLLKTIGVKDKRGDWDESKGQHLLWQPAAVAFAPNGDMYIGEGHANESPNDVDSDDPASLNGASRVLHFDRDGTFVNQWYGDDIGQGKFDQTHGLAVDPRTGDVWIGDREQYRIVIYNADGKFLRTVQMRNLVCAIAFDAKGDPWITSGQDGQVLRIDRNGKVLGAVGAGMGIEPGQFIEAAYFAFDKGGNIYVGDTSIGRIAKISPPARKP